MLLCHIGLVILLKFVLIGFIAWTLAPQWTKAKRRDTHGRNFYEIIGRLDSPLWNGIRQCFDHLSSQTKQVNRDGPALWIRMLFSYIVVVLHRSLIAGRMTHDEMDEVLTAYGELAESVPKEAIEGLVERVKFAKWAYPFDENYNRLEDCLRKEGFLLLEHDTVTAPGKVAHYTAINKIKKVLLIVPRGSCGLADVLTDLAAVPVQHTFEQADDPRLRRIVSHEGFLMAANALAAGHASLVDRLVSREGYTVEIVGHSLGAAVASLMGIILLSRVPSLKDPNRLRIFAYACPPCLNADASKAIKPYISSVVWNDDVVPTLSVANYVFTCKCIAHMERKESDFHGTFAVPKALLLAAASAFGWTSLSLSQERLDHIRYDAVNLVKSLHQERQLQQCPKDVYVPGKVMYLWQRRNRNQPTGDVNGVMAPGNRLIHLALVVPTKDSLKDHFLGAYEQGLKQLLEQLELEA